MTNNYDTSLLLEELRKETERVQESLSERERKIEQKINNTIKNIKKAEKEALKTDFYTQVLEEMTSANKKMQEDLTAQIADHEDARNKMLATDIWYYNELSKLDEKLKNKQMDSDSYDQHVKGLNNLYAVQKQAATEDIWEEHGEKIGNIFGDELYKVLTEYGDFEIGMKNITKRIYEYIIQESIKATLQQIFGIKAVNQMLSGLLAGTGLIQNPVATGLIKGISKVVGFKFHSGGVMPVGANTNIPGTQEQLALLKGGERILSPSENTSYKSNESNGTSPVVFNNYNIKAWDSKDVQKYLLENRDLLNSITYDGIKNNSNSLRQIVRYA